MMLVFGTLILGETESVLYAFDVLLLFYPRNVAARERQFRCRLFEGGMLIGLNHNVARGNMIQRASSLKINSTDENLPSETDSRQNR
jgi:hypothetical protein